MKVEISSFCDFAQETAGKLTVVGTFDTIISRNFPCVHPQLSMVIRLRFDMWEFKPHSFRIETVDVAGEFRIDPISGTLDVRGGGNATSVTHLVFTMGNLRFLHEGVVNFVLYLDDKEVAALPLYIKKADAQ